MDRIVIRRFGGKRCRASEGWHVFGICVLPFVLDRIAGYRIHAARMKGVASQNALCGKPHPLSDTITGDRLVRIFRTGWVKPACGA